MTYFVDTTLRDGEQAPGVIFSHAQKMEIAHRLNEIGVEELEVGTPAIGKEERKIIKRIANAGFHYRTISWCRARKEDIDYAAECETDAVSISFPASEVQLDALGKDQAWIREQAKLLIEYAQSKFDFVIVGIQDATRADSLFLLELVDLFCQYKVNRIRIADTVGCMTPVTVQKLFTKLSTQFPAVDFEFHPHNDLGMATANAYMALASGASGISATVNGLGERAGNAVLEQLLVAQHIEHDETKYKLPMLKPLSEYVASISKRVLPLDKPIVGACAFRHETGIHVKSVLKNKMSYQLFDEAILGVDSNEIVIGKHSGGASLLHFLQQKGITATIEHAKILQEKIKERFQSSRESLTDEGILKMYFSLL